MLSNKYFFVKKYLFDLIRKEKKNIIYEFKMEKTV